MAGFKFKLDKVLEFRKQAEEKAMQALGIARQNLLNQQHAVQALHDEMARHESTRNSKKELTAGDIWLYQQYRERLLHDIRQGELLLESLEKQVEQAQQQLIIKAKDRKLLEKFKEQQAVKYAREQSLNEQKEYDEMSTIRFGQQQDI